MSFKGAIRCFIFWQSQDRFFPPATSLSFILDTHDSDLIDSYCDTKRGLGLQSQKLACSNVFSCLYWVSNFLIIVRINKNAASVPQYNPSSQKVYSVSPSSLMQPPSLLPHPWHIAAGETLPIWHDWGVVNLFPWLRELDELMDFSQLQCSCASTRKVKNIFSQGKICAQTRNTLFVQECHTCISALGADSICIWFSATLILSVTSIPSFTAGGFHLEEAP